MTKEGITADLESMKKVGIGGGIFLEVNIGIPKGPVKYMTPEWRSIVAHAAKEADRLGMAISLGTGPGWCGTGGPWVKPEEAMQHLVSSETKVSGPSKFLEKLPQPKPRNPFFGVGTLTPELKKQWEQFYRDEVVLAVPATSATSGIPDLDEKSLVYRAPYSSVPGVKPYIFPSSGLAPTGTTVAVDRVIDISSKMRPDGTLRWDVPAGNWTILRFGRTLTGQTTRPAPDAGLGFETDKFETTGIKAHLKTFVDSILKETGPNRTPGQGLTGLHFDSWEMGSQNWSANFRSMFKQRRGYDPAPYLPVMAGKIIGSVDVSERFLWDLRQTAQELVIDNHMGPIKDRGKQSGLNLTVEPYDMNPTSDMELGATADIPSAEFWSKGYGYPCEYSCLEAVSIAHTNGKPVIAAEAFTSESSDAWLQHPASMKEQGDWALAAGINKFTYHRYQHQPKLDEFPGMTMGPYGVHWERTQTWWDLSKAYHDYISRSQYLLRQGLPVADILYLVPEGAPNVFQAPPSATVGDLPDRRGYNFDACAPGTLISRASVKNGQIVFPDGMSYRMLVLPRIETMTPRLLAKIALLVKAGATVVGNPPKRSPSLVGYPNVDKEVDATATQLWEKPGKGQVFRDTETMQIPATLKDAQWIWTKGGNPKSSAAVGRANFQTRFHIPADRGIVSARIAVTADNEFVASLNGQSVARGTNFNQVQEVDVLKQIRVGENNLSIQVDNVGLSPNPAGLIASLTIRYRDGEAVTFNTDRSWKSGNEGVQVLGNWTTSPWNLGEGSIPRLPMYPSYDFTAKILRDNLNVAQDVQSGDALRYGHRRIWTTDVYFIGNRSASEYKGTVGFRVNLGYPEWWNPMTGERRPLPVFTRKGSQTMIPLTLKGRESGFIVFSGTRPPSKGNKINFPELKARVTINGPWDVAFSAPYTTPKPTKFETLIDWSKSGIEDLKFFSGKATYTKVFDASQLAGKQTMLSLGEVRNIASVRLNGKDLGVTWCAPWQVSIPARLLTAKGNRLEVTVANLWTNRLIGDAGKPELQRMTKVSWSPLSAQSPLQPSGLLGPVKILE